MKKVNYYSDEFKTKVILEVLSGKVCKDEARRKYGIGGKSTVLKWIRKYEESRPKRICMNNKKKTTVEDLKLEIEQLKHQLEYEKLKSEAYNSMIEIAEEEFKIPIRKKSGAKQSKI